MVYKEAEEIVQLRKVSGYGWADTSPPAFLLLTIGHFEGMGR